MKGNIYINMPVNTIPVEVSRIADAKTLWINRSVGTVDGISFGLIDFEQFAREFAFAIPDSECFSKTLFESNTSQIHLAERYGGRGVGGNGGGARTTAKGSFQMKGTGGNLLAGERMARHHSYGGLDAPNALVEAIYSIVLDRLLPVGVAKVYGLVYVGEDVGVYGLDDNTSRSCWGLILVREKCIRPAHYLRSPHFRPKSKFREKFFSDVGRTRLINKELYAFLEEKDIYYSEYLKYFLDNCANQLSFARIMRVAHSVLTPSNISFDGRWLDVSTVDFLSGGVNYCRANVPFLAEVTCPIEIVDELKNTFMKYNRVLIDFESLRQYYFLRLGDYFKRHILYFFGLGTELCDQIFRSVELENVTKISSRVFSSNTIIGPATSRAMKDDPVVKMLEGAYLSTNNEALAHERLVSAGLGSNEAALFMSAFNGLLKKCYEQEKNISNFGVYVVSRAISSLKKARMSALFDAATVYGEVHYLIDNGGKSDVNNLLQFYEDAAAWIYETDSSSMLTIYKSDVVIIKYTKDGAYSIEMFEESERLVGSFRELISIFDGLGPHALQLKLFLCNHYIESLQDVIPVLEDKFD